MPAFRRRKYSRRRFKRSFKRGWWKRRQRRGTGQTGVRFFKIRRVVSLMSSSATFVIHTEIDNNPSLSGDWTAIAALFDSYRVAATKVKFVPSLPNESAVNTSTLYRPLYVAADIDSVTMSSFSVDQAIQYENCSVKNLFRPWKYYVKWPKATYISGGQSMFAGGFLDIAAPRASGSIQMITPQDYNTDTLYGTVVVTHYVMAKNRR